MSAYPYRTQAVRDLAWACFSPALLEIAQVAGAHPPVTDCALPLTADRRRWLEQLDRHPEPLLALLARQPRRRLGLYFEQLWHFFLEQDREVELLAHNLAVRDGRRTVGEFDILYYCRRRQRPVHLELAVKYYLGRRGATRDEPHSQWREWLGPNARDRLDLKLDQLLQHQTRLAEHPRSRQRLAALGVADPLREVALKGWLFQHTDDPLPPPAAFNGHHPMADWLRLDRLPSYLQQRGEMSYIVLPRLRWLAPARATTAGETETRSALAKRIQCQLAQSPRAVLVAGLGDDDLECCRFFVTPDGWPAAGH